MARRLRMATAVLRPRVSEKAEQQHIVQLLRTLGAQVYVMGTVRRRGDYAGTMQTPGIPDLMAFLPERDYPLPAGQFAGFEQAWQEAPHVPTAFLPAAEPTRRRLFLFIEVKALGGRLRPEQLAFQASCQAAQLAHIVGGLDAVIAWLIARRYLTADSVAHYRVPAPEARP